MYEYLQVARSPVVYYPDDDLPLTAAMGFAKWNKFFDCLLITSPFLIHAVKALQSGEELFPTPHVPGKRVVEQYAHLVFLLDKMKFTKITESSPMEMLE